TSARTRTRPSMRPGGSGPASARPSRSAWSPPSRSPAAATLRRAAIPAPSSSAHNRCSLDTEARAPLDPGVRTVAYGSRPLALPEGLAAEVLLPPPPPPEADLDDLLSRALAQPVQSPRLAQLAPA